MSEHSQQARLALIGAGRMGITHIEAIAGAASVALTAVIDPSEPARARAQDVGRGVATFADLDAALAAGPIDAVLIAAPSTLHRTLVTACAQRGLPMLCEKPCGTAVTEIDAAAATAAAAGVVLQIGYWRRYVPGLIELRETIATGTLGEISLIACWQWDAGPGSPEFRAASGGIAVDMGVHEFDQARWLTGQEIGTPSMTSSTVTSVAPVPGDVESAAILAPLSGGAVVFISLGRHFPHGDCVWVEVMGTRGHARQDVLWGEAGDAVFRAALRAQVEDFVHRVRSGEPGSGASAVDARAALAAAEQAQQALASAGCRAPRRLTIGLTGGAERPPSNGAA
jgi:myo-inositol 2-dehydrogenase/D-chiro-inositol 1-dehydrogenase